MRRNFAFIGVAAIAATGLWLYAQPLAFVDRYQSTLGSGCTSPCTSISVSSASGLPSGATFFYATVKADGGNTEEVFLVSNVSGTTLTVVGAKAGTTASSHGAGATIIASIMTKDALTQMELDVQSVTVTNAASTGTTSAKLAKLTGAPSTAVITATTDTGGAIGIVTAGAGTSGSALVQFAGTATCIYDAATTAGDYVQISSSTAGDCHDAGSTLPTSGQTVGRVLSTNGGGGSYSTLLFPPESKPGTASGLTLIEQHTASSSATLDFTTCLSSTYDDYLIEVDKLVPSTSLVNINMRFSTDGGSTYDSGSNYAWVGERQSVGGAGPGGSNATTSIGLDVSGTVVNTASHGGIAASMKLFMGSPGSVRPRAWWWGGIDDGTVNLVITIQGTAQYLSTTAVNAFRILASSGNLASGSVRCYGEAK